MTHRPRVVLFGPSLDALSGVSTHVRMLAGSDLTKDFELLHFQVGREGRKENKLQRLLRLVSGPWQLARLLVKSGAEIVHLNTSLDPKGYWRDLLFFAVAKLLGRRVVNQIHGGAMPQNFFAGHRLLTWILRRFLIMSDVVAVLSRAELEAYRAFDARMRVYQVPNAIDPRGLADVARDYNADSELRLVFVGRLVRAKGLFEILQALAELKASGRRFRFTVAGEGVDGAVLRAEAVRAGLSQRVRFLGCVTGDDKYRLLLDSDLFLLPSHFEGLPYSLLEAMAAGCPPVTTAVAAIPDVMRDGEHGRFVPVGDARAIAAAIDACDGDRESLRRMAEAGRKRVRERYTVSRLAADFRELYGRCLA